MVQGLTYRQHGEKGKENMSNNRIKVEYIPTNKPNNYIKCELYYSLGGMNYFTYKNEPRGYYVSVSPVERDIRPNGVTLESFRAFSGYKRCVVSVERKSKKAQEKALEVYEAHKADMLTAFADVLENIA